MDSHTLAMNRVLGLAMRRGGGWPTTLHDHGYRVLAIEADVRAGRRRASPDIVLLNETAGHILAIDCKGGANVDPDQDRRYSRMALGDLVEATRPPCAVGAHTVAYAIGEGSEARVRAHTGLALVVFGRDSVRVVGDLGHDGLTACLREGVRLGGADVPEEDIYPFSVHDSDDDIDYKVAGAVMAYMSARPEMATRHLVNLEVARGVLAVAHPLRPRFSAQHAREMARATKQSMARLESSGALGRMLDALRHAGSGMRDMR